jgi:hypothetical protein
MVAQQNGSLVQTMAAQASQAPSRAPPWVQAGWSQAGAPPSAPPAPVLALVLPAQSCGQKTADSPGEHTPSPQTRPPEDDDVVLDAVDDEDDEDDATAVVEDALDELTCADACVEVAVPAPPLPLPPAPVANRSSTERPHAATAEAAIATPAARRSVPQPTNEDAERRAMSQLLAGQGIVRRFRWR